VVGSESVVFGRRERADGADPIEAIVDAVAAVLT
jgi:hypothetical protein